MDAATRRWKKQHPGMNAVAQGKNGKLEVFHNKAFKTRGGLTKKDLMKNKHGRIVSRKASAAAKKKFKRVDFQLYFLNFLKYNIDHLLRYFLLIL